MVHTTFTWVTEKWAAEGIKGLPARPILAADERRLKTGFAWLVIRGMRIDDDAYGKVGRALQPNAANFLARGPK